MDVELQIRKHLPRDAQPTVAIIDEYCAEYKNLFKEVPVLSLLRFSI